MALVLRYLDDINRYLNRFEDSRTSKFLFMSSPFYTLAICLTYVFIVKVVGPKLMENRKPYKLKNTLIVYNFLQVVFSIYLFLEIGMSGWLTGKYNWRCQPVDYSNSPDSIRAVNASWWYYFSKFTEFFDTFFFVLRKKNDHISTLHVIHHGVMPMSVWFGVKFTPGGHSTFFGFLNTFVHIVMYTYYMISAFGPQVQKYLWWKKYLTALQLIQFVGIMVHAFQLLFIDCPYPRAFVWWIGMHAVMFFFLFRDFYNQAYNKMAARRRNAAEQKSKEQELLNGKSNGQHQATENGHIVVANGKTHSPSEENGHSNGPTKNGVNYYALNNGELHQRSRTLH